MNDFHGVSTASAGREGTLTAEIAIINRSGIALAADSAVTIGRQRVWKTTNKLFALSPTHDIGIMVYGAGDFVGHPWDTIIKEFRTTAATAQFDTVKEASDAFFEYLRTVELTDRRSQELSAYSLFVELAEAIKDDLQYEGKIDFRKKFLASARESIAEFEESEVCLDLTLADFNDMYGELCVSFFKEITGENFTKALKDATIRVCHEAFRRRVASSYFTGVVIAGFGRNELLPHVRNFTLDGRHNGHLRFWEDRKLDLNTTPETGGTIWPFGQADVAHLFMEGTSLDQLDYVEAMLEGILSKKSSDLVTAYVHDDKERVVEKRRQHDDDAKIVDRFMEEYRRYRHERQVKPVTSVVSTLPKEEMAAMAEALVDITGLRRKVDSRIETVAGPIDVAFISKGDGFIWMKRKHYFDIDLNADFLKRKALRHKGGME